MNTELPSSFQAGKVRQICMSSLSISGLEDILVLSFPLNFSFSNSGSRNEMEHLSQREEGEVTQDRMGKRLQDPLHQQQLKMTLDQLMHMVEPSPCPIRLQLHLLSELTVSGSWKNSIALISTFSHVSVCLILILNAVQSVSITDVVPIFICLSSFENNIPPRGHSQGNMLSTWLHLKNQWGVFKLLVLESQPVFQTIYSGSSGQIGHSCFQRLSWDVKAPIHYVKGHSPLDSYLFAIFLQGLPGSFTF